MKIQDVQACPLCWPEGWPRTPAHVQEAGNQFKVAGDAPEGLGWRPRRFITFERARRLLRDELGRLGATNVVLSTNVPLRNDGEPRSSHADKRQADPGVAVYFMLKGRQMVMAQDSYSWLAANTRSLGLAIEALRSLERHGGGKMMERAFAGFAALPAPDGVMPKRAWWVVMNYSEDPDERLDLSPDEVDARFRVLAKRRHPDVHGGSIEAFQELQDARDEAIKALGG
jgi:hypothetical protein